MGEPKTTDEWQAEDHIEELKKVPDLVNCAAADPMSKALIFFGRQIGDQRTAIKALPEAVAVIVIAKLKANGGTGAARWRTSGVLAGLGALGFPTPLLAFMFFVGKSKGWW